MFSTLDTLLASGGAFTVYSPLVPRVDMSPTLPYVEYKRIGENSDHYLSGVRVYSTARIAVVMCAATEAGLLVLIGQVQAKLDYNRTNFILSFPALGPYGEGHEDNPVMFYAKSDWFILY